MTGPKVPPGGEKPKAMSNPNMPNPNMPSSKEGIAALDPKIQDVLGKALRAMSKDIVAEPIPDKFMALLAALEAKESKG